MTDSPLGESPHSRLRIWPGIVVAALLLIFRFGVKALVPGIQGFGYAVMGSLAFNLGRLTLRVKNKLRYGPVSVNTPTGKCYNLAGL